ncbi:MAG: phage tail tape measure protein [Victivallaceae bacterium]
MPSSSNIRAGAAYIELTVENSALVRGLKAAQMKLKNFSRSVTAAGKKLLAISAVMALPFAAGAKTFADFEEQMANVSTMLDEPAKYMAAYTEGVRKMSVEFGEGTDTLAKGLYDILSASIDPAKALDVLAVSAKAARAGITDTGIAADAITTLLNAYGLSADYAESVSDLLFKTVKKGKTTFAELAPSIGMVATTAASAGVPLEELGAAIATMTRNGVKTENAVTALNAIISTFLKPTDEAAAYAKKLGFEMSSAAIKSEGLEGIFKKISKLPPDAVSKLFPNIRALRGVLPALRNMEGFSEDIKTMKNRAGATQTAYAKMANSLSMSFARLKQAGMLALSVIGEALAEDLQKAASVLMRVITSIIAFIKQNKKLVVTAAKVVGVVAMIAGGLLTLGAIAGTLSFAIGGLLTIISAITGTISFFAGIIGGVISILTVSISVWWLVAAAVAAVGATFLIQSGVIGKVIDWFGAKFAQLKEFACTAFDGIKAALASGDYSLAARILWLSLQVAWQKGISVLLGYWINFKQAFMTATLETFYGALSIITDSWASLKSAWVNVVGFLKKFWIGFTGAIMKAWNSTFAWLAKKWLDIKGMFDDSIDVEAEKEQIDAEAAKKNAGEDAAYNQIDADSQKQKSQIEQRRQAEQEAIGQQMADDLKEHNAQYADELSKSKQALTNARKEWQAAISEAKDKAKATKKPESGPVKDAKAKLQNSGKTVAAAQAKVQVQGSFYAQATRSLSSGTAAERTAVATEDIKKNTKKTNKLLENSGFNFT